jgi:hypothetical protein
LSSRPKVRLWPILLQGGHEDLDLPRVLRLSKPPINMFARLTYLSWNVSASMVGTSLAALSPGRCDLLAKAQCVQHLWFGQARHESWISSEKIDLKEASRLAEAWCRGNIIQVILSSTSLRSFLLCTHPQQVRTWCGCLCERRWFHLPQDMWWALQFWSQVRVGQQG